MTEHGNVETENEIYEIKGYDYDTKVWSHHHNPRTVANNPAGEITLNMGITGPALHDRRRLCRRQCRADPGRADAAAGRMRRGAGRRRLAKAFTRSASSPASRAKARWPRTSDPAQAVAPFDRDRNGIVVAEGGCVYVLERLSDAKNRGAKIYGELAGYAMNTDATDFVLPNPERQAQCIAAGAAARRAGAGGDRHRQHPRHGHQQRRRPGVRCAARVFGDCKTVKFNNTKSFIGHAMGAAGALELAGNLAGLRRRRRATPRSTSTTSIPSALCRD